MSSIYVCISPIFFFDGMSFFFTYLLFVEVLSQQHYNLISLSRFLTLTIFFVLQNCHGIKLQSTPWIIPIGKMATSKNPIIGRGSRITCSCLWLKKSWNTHPPKGTRFSTSRITSGSRKSSKIQVLSQFQVPSTF